MVSCSSSIQALMEWMAKSHDFRIQIDDVVARSGWSKWHLQREFKNHTGLTLGSYLFERRMTAARDMLKVGDELINITDLSGYSDQSSFHRAFKKRFGITPLKFAKKYACKKRNNK